MAHMSSISPPRGQYMFDNGNPVADTQTKLLADMLDGHSRHILATLGVGQGWRCLDLGSGAGTIASWLSTCTGRTGRVIALDKDPRHVRTTAPVDVVSADVTADHIGKAEFDLVHARLLLMHLPERRQVLHKAMSALKPGGYLVTSDWDCTALPAMMVRAEPAVVRAFDVFQQAMAAIAVEAGASLSWAREAPTAFHDAGLVDVQATEHNQLWSGGQAGCLLHDCNSRQLEAALLSHGISAAELDLLRSGMHDPTTLAWSYPMITAVGRKPIPANR